MSDEFKANLFITTFTASAIIATALIVAMF
jgi:hypothetical protein